MSQMAGLTGEVPVTSVTARWLLRQHAVPQACLCLQNGMPDQNNIVDVSEASQNVDLVLQRVAVMAYDDLLNSHRKLTFPSKAVRRAPTDYISHSQVCDPAPKH